MCSTCVHRMFVHVHLISTFILKYSSNVVFTHTHTHTRTGTPDALTLCIGQICNIMLENPPRGPLIPYKPHALPNQAYQPRVNVSVVDHKMFTNSSSSSLSLPLFPPSPSLPTHTHSPTYLTKLHTLLVSSVVIIVLESS